MPVYIIRAGETPNVKIGWADDDVEQRRKDLQVGCWLPLHVIRVIDGPRSLEGWLHRHFDDLRGPLGEWFTFDAAMLKVTLDDVRPAPKEPRPVPPYGERLQAAVRAGGGVKKLAAVLGVVPSAIPQWTRVPARHCQKVAMFTGIPVTELRPDIFGSSAEAA